MNNKFYITTTAPYVNAKPHIGFALEIIQADVVARYHRVLGDDVFFNFGTDEHGQKIYQKALSEKKDPQKYVDENAKEFDALKAALNLSYNSYVRTTEPRHIKAAQEIWNRCFKNGYIKKGIYKAKYCVGCELEKTDSELEHGKCPLHPNLHIQTFEEENYFFKFSRFQQELQQLYQKNPDFVMPKHRLLEINNFVSKGLQDFSVSRLKEKMPWGIPVPNDDKHVMYVWFDALTFYISALDWPDNAEKFSNYWGTHDKPNAIQMAGKDNLRQQSAMWQAMLMAAGLPPTKQIFIHGFITSAGQKMSKSLGNVIDPFHYVKKFGTDSLRYYLLAKLSPTEDSDFTENKFKEAYNADLANGLGNLVARVTKLCETNNVSLLPDRLPDIEDSLLIGGYKEHLERFEFNLALEEIWRDIKKIDIKINNDKPWELNQKEVYDKLQKYARGLVNIAFALQPFLPITAKKILAQFSAPTIKSQPPLFPRLA